MTALFRLLARAPLPLMHALGGLLGWLVWALAPDYRRRFRENTAQAGLAPAQWRPAIAAAGRMAAELPWLWARPAGESVLPRVRQWTGDEALGAALAAGRGAIVISPHLGCWELLGQALGERFLASHGPITALFRPPRKPWMAALMEGSRDRPGLHMLPTDVSGVRGLMRALKKGGYTGILPDQVPPMGQGVWAPFFGRPAYTMTLVPRLAQLTGAQVFLGVCERLPRGRGYAVRLQPLDAPALSDPKAAPEEAATAMNQGIEQLILSLPGQYVWDYARYKAPRAEMETAR